jgi:outer membrane protein OmpA-like peptidoglycan-associated protein
VKDKFFIAVIVFSVAIVLPDAFQIYADDCSGLWDNIKKQRSLIQQRQSLTTILEQCADDPLINYKYAYNCERLRKYEEALQYYIKASELDPSYHNAYYGAGDVYMVLGKPGPAIKMFEKGLEIKSSTRAKKSLKLAKIKYKAQMGDAVTTDEFVTVMEESKRKPTTAGAIDGPILRIQIQFGTSSSTIPETAKERLKTVGMALQHESLIKSKFEVAGHTDNIGNSESNMILSKKRAESVKQYLVQHYNIPTNRLVVAYYGQTMPAAPNTSKENQAINRRVEFKRLD